MTEPLWTPSPERVARARMTAFLHHCQEQWQAEVTDCPSLYQWSIGHPREFWSSMWTFGDVCASRDWDEVVVDFDRMPGATWFPGARLNFAQNLLRFRDDHPALISCNERGRQATLSYSELYRQVSCVSGWLKSVGVQAGDRVAGFVPNLPEAVVAMLATTSLGAIWSSTSPDFGEKGVLDRFGQIEPKVVFAADGYMYNGTIYDSLERVASFAGRIPSLEHVVVIPYVHHQPVIRDFNRSVLFTELQNSDNEQDVAFEQLPCDHPVYILYSSGTTGPPKCIVHGAGGTLIQHLKELILHTNLSRDDRILYVTTCGWMMWNWLVSSLSIGATVVLYDGSPFAPASSSLFNLVEEERITVFGTSARYLAAVEKMGLEPARTHDLSALQTILSTGSPLLPESFDYVYGKIRSDLQLSSISGGTDIVSCFALGNPIGSVYRGELQTRGLGMDVQVYSDLGKPVRQQKGELVCVAPFPSMPVGFWNDPDGAMCRRAYFGVFPGVWRHGDFVELTEHDGMIIYGRSDAILNPGGVRIGTAEIYRQVELIPEVLESVAVGQECDGDVRIVLFVRLREDVVMDGSLVERIQHQIRTGATPRHVPKVVLQVADIPRTRSGKIVELAIRDVIHHRSVQNREALANPESLALFQNIPELTT